MVRRPFFLIQGPNGGQRPVRAGIKLLTLLWRCGEEPLNERYYADFRKNRIYFPDIPRREIPGNIPEIPGNMWKHREISGKPPEISKIPLLQGSPERDSVPRSAPPFCPGQVPPPPTGSLCVLPLLRKSRLRLFGSGYIIILRTGLAPDN